MLGRSTAAPVHTLEAPAARPLAGLMMDGNHDRPELNLHKEFITPANINDLFAKYDVPKEFDLLSIGAA